MKTKALTAAQIDTLAQRLSDTPIEPATSAKKASDNFARLLAARIGDERAALAFTSILTAETFDQAEARLTLVLDYGNTDPAGEPIRAANKRAKLSPAFLALVAGSIGVSERRWASVSICAAVKALVFMVRS